MAEKICFVIMGFGIKTDFKTGREIDLDKTYHNIIKPVFEELGFYCFRADEIKHSGVIDTHMYESILKSDFVIADISTLNPNVFYELGIRHAVKKYSTLIIAEKELDYPFDISHIAIDSYEHLGKDIGYSEAIRFQQMLKDKVTVLIDKPEIDSPLYSLIPNLETPKFTDAEIKEIKEEVEEHKSVSQLLEEAEAARKNKEYANAIELLKEAKTVYPHNDFITQRLVSVIYKSKTPNVGTALFEAESILESLNPQATTDPETLGLSGAINKRLFEEYQDNNYLDKALWFYERGFYIKQDYYNGINLAFMYTIKATLEELEFNAIADYGNAIRFRKKVIEICGKIISNDNFNERDDKEWVYLTMAEAYLGTDDAEKESKYLKLAMEIIEKESKGRFAADSYNEQKAKLEAAMKAFHDKYKK